MYLKICDLNDYGAGVYIITSELKITENDYFILEFENFNNFEIYYNPYKIQKSYVENNPLFLIDYGKIIKYDRDKITDLNVIEYIDNKIESLAFYV